MQKPKEIASLITPFRLLMAISLGLLVSVIMIVKDFDIELYRSLSLGGKSLFYLGCALFLVIVRDFCYILRLRILTDNKISWHGNFQVIMLWEFASALTPSVVGGSAVAFFFVGKEINNTGRATAIVLVTALLDELFYVVMVPIVFLLASTDKLFVNDNFELFGKWLLAVPTIFILGYLFILVLVLLISFGIFIRPQWIKNLLVFIFSRKFLKHWFRRAVRMANEIVITSQEMKDKPLLFWLKAFGVTIISWTARFFVVNFLILTLVSGGDQLLIFARQLVMWVILLISPTPGGSGIAEYIFPKFLGEFTNPYGNEIALIWRLLTYYSYLIIGSIILPAWLKRHFGKH